MNNFAHDRYHAEHFIELKCRYTILSRFLQLYIVYHHHDSLCCPSVPANRLPSKIPCRKENQRLMRAVGNSVLCSDSKLVELAAVSRPRDAGKKKKRTVLFKVDNVTDHLHL